MAKLKFKDKFSDEDLMLGLEYSCLHKAELETDTRGFVFPSDDEEDYGLDVELIIEKNQLISSKCDCGKEFCEHAAALCFESLDLEIYDYDEAKLKKLIPLKRVKNYFNEFIDQTKYFSAEDAFNDALYLDFTANKATLEELLEYVDKYLVKLTKETLDDDYEFRSWLDVPTYSNIIRVIEALNEVKRFDLASFLALKLIKSNAHAPIDFLYKDLIRNLGESLLNITDKDYDYKEVIDLIEKDYLPLEDLVEIVIRLNYDDALRTKVTEALKTRRANNLDYEELVRNFALRAYFPLEEAIKFHEKFDKGEC